MQELLIEFMQRLDIMDPSPNTREALELSPKVDEIKLNMLTSILKKLQDQLKELDYKLYSLQTEGILFFFFKFINYI